MTLPAVNGPIDVPALRDWLYQRFKHGGALNHLDGRFVSDTMRTASLWWVEPETCHLLADAASTWPDDKPLDLDDLPTKSGFAVFADNLVGTDAHPEAQGHEMWVSAICWGPVHLPNVDTGSYTESLRLGLGIGMFSRHDLHMGLGHDDLLRATRVLPYLLDEIFTPETVARVTHKEPELRHHNQIATAVFSGDDIGSLYAYVGRTDWLHGNGVEGVTEGNPHGDNPTTARSMAEDRRLLATLWAITRTPIVTTVRTHPPRHIARRSQRKGLDAAVRVLRLGGPHRENIVTSTAVTRDWKHSWVVRPHWRWQACGPHWSERRLILVGPYTKGPSDKPLLGGERVWRVVPPPR